MLVGLRLLIGSLQTAQMDRQPMRLESEFAAARREARKVKVLAIGMMDRVLSPLRPSTFS